MCCLRCEFGLSVCFFVVVLVLLSAWLFVVWPLCLFDVVVCCGAVLHYLFLFTCVLP